jgi:hypothetical protein
MLIENFNELDLKKIKEMFTLSVISHWQQEFATLNFVWKDF